MITVKQYHDRTKHSLKAYAKGPETLDWNDQPDPYRRFKDCETFALPKPGKESPVCWSNLGRLDTINPQPINLDNLGLLLELSFGLAVWKEYGGDRWALRCNPSSGNLHPTEAYIINGTVEALPQGVYHYVSIDHHLEQRCAFKNSALEESLLIGMSSIHWREAWKYGERAYRYCQLDVGHALAALSYAASSLGWSVELLSDYSDVEIACLMGLDCKDEFIVNESETPDMLCRIRYKPSEAYLISHKEERRQLLQTLQQNDWVGQAYPLKAYHMYHWPVIDEVSQAAVKNNSTQLDKTDTELIELSNSICDIQISQIIRQRRSAQHFNPHVEPMQQTDFFRMLSAVLPSQHVPFKTWSYSELVHLCLFIHNVKDLEAGLYALPRNLNALGFLQEQLANDFLWQSVEEFDRLFLLRPADVRKAAKTLSCHQAIACDSAFSLAMLSEFRSTITKHPWLYRRLFWECGVIGQILYLEAETLGYRGTGIGCFFDDEVHELLGIESDQLQSLYHFTVGRPLVDSRLLTRPPYSHLL